MQSTVQPSRYVHSSAKQLSIKQKDCLTSIAYEGWCENLLTYSGIIIVFAQCSKFVSKKLNLTTKQILKALYKLDTVNSSICTMIVK